MKKVPPPAPFFLAGIVIFFVLGENSVCRSVSCMRKQYNVGDEICYFTDDSMYHVGEEENGRFASLYFTFRNGIPQSKTVVTSGRKVIAILDPGDATPFIKEVLDDSEHCVTIK